MSVDWGDLVAKSLPAVVPLLTALYAATRGPGVIRERLKNDAEVLEKLPDSDARTQLLELIGDEVRALRQYNSAKRDLTSLGMALVAAPALGYLALWLAGLGPWWGPPAALVAGFLALACTYGIFESAQRVPRDAKGRRLQVGQSGEASEAADVPPEVESARPAE
ncbi:hypothetical protein GCM10009530_11930 [Microbispora corallina]|uniref:Holin of 3TMs, for gene-transfer release n=1 Tax=Microbispora corallina TaxID=83302 RepID=A0ABQ4FTG4_9ACTN|nr:hypothetical protein [Microbispora corallina]GIH38110.1 hypothetical protein Mco01_11100 [Microbispora corallina]